MRSNSIGSNIWTGVVVHGGFVQTKKYIYMLKNIRTFTAMKEIHMHEKYVQKFEKLVRTT